jgi:hypothetical protein
LWLLTGVGMQFCDACQLSKLKVPLIVAIAEPDYECFSKIHYVQMSTSK